MTLPLRRVLVTGANQGIGLALAKQLVADHGCHVYLGSRSAEKGNKVLEEEFEAGDSVELLQIDVSSDESVEAAASDLSARLGDEKLYAIVNNAGIISNEQNRASAVLNTNTRGPIRVVDNFIKHLQPKGRIVNLGSGGGPNFVSTLRGKDKERYMNAMSNDEIEAEIAKIEAMGEGFSSYQGSKALVTCYTMALAEKYPELMCSSVSPGWILTNMTRGMGASKSPEEGTVSLRKCLFENLPKSGWYWGSDGLRSPLHYMRNPGEPEYVEEESMTFAN